MDFVQEHDLWDAHTLILEDKKRWNEAADVYLRRGQKITAIQTLLKDTGERSLRKAKDCLLEGLWASFSFGVRRESASKKVQGHMDDLLQIISQLDRSVVRNEDSMKVSLLVTLLNEISTTLHYAVRHVQSHSRT